MKALKIFHIVFFIMLNNVQFSNAQDYPYSTKQYDFIQYERNKLWMPEDSQSFIGFYKKLDKLMFEGEGKINLIHIGGSHVQADIVSNRVRERLSTFHPGNKGSRGLLFPFRVAGTNNPYNYTVNYTGNWENCKNTQHNIPCELGLTGISVTTYDSLSSITISFDSHVAKSYNFNKLRIYHALSSDLFSIIPIGIDSTKYTVVTDTSKGITELFFHSSHTQMGVQFVKKDSTQRHFVLYGMQFENDESGITYHSIGVNGASTHSYLRCSLFDEHMAEIKPDMVIMGIGINDASGKDFDVSVFESNYRKLIASIRTVSPDVAIILITNNDSFRKSRRKYYVNKNGDVVKDAMYRLSTELNVAVWDFYNIMGAQSSMDTWYKNGLAQRDRVHFTSSGYKIMGDLLSESILRGLENYLKRNYISMQE
jgi:lysophospholipase L1-like esterase